MKLTAIQMNMRLGDPEYNFGNARALIERAAEARPDVIILPETWNTGFFPKEGLEALSDSNGSRVRYEIAALAKAKRVNIVAGSVANVKRGRVYNTAYTFDRAGRCVNEYDKLHLFSPMGEHGYFAFGENRANVFKLDGVICGLIICYDLRFPELIRSLALSGAEVVFAVAQWPAARIEQAEALCRARAIENQLFLSFTNSCGTAGNTTYGGASTVFDPYGKCVARAGEGEALLTAELDMNCIKGLRDSIPVFRDRRPDMYAL